MIFGDCDHTWKFGHDCVYPQMLGVKKWPLIGSLQRCRWGEHNFERQLVILADNLQPVGDAEQMTAVIEGVFI